MTGSLLDRYADDFERLRALPADEREAALAALPMSEDERVVLRRLLDADTDADDPLARALGESAVRLSVSRQERIGPYRLLRELGSGGMGTVFLAERVDGGFAQAVAIKLLRGFPTADGLRRLRRERQILASLDHPNIAHLLDGGETSDGQPWLALEHVDGLSLLDYAARHAPRLHDRLALFDAMLDAVAHAHQRLVIHRDIKPANVLVDAAGEVKLLDFGIARLVETDTADVRETSTRVFSQGYASPEQRDGRAITTASDIYSLGMVLRELVGGPARAPSSLPPLPLDAELAGIIAKATDDDPARRYASAGEFRDDLDRYRDGRPVRASRMTRAYRLRKFFGRHRLGVAAALAAALVLGVFVWRLEREREHALAAEARAQEARIDSERDAASARAALTFLSDAFLAAAPENALSKTVSVRELLDKAKANLDGSTLDPTVTKSIQRLLGRLYDSLGDKQASIELFQRGLDGITPSSRAEALEAAIDYDQLGNLLGILDRSAEARSAIDKAAALRDRFAPGDALAHAWNAVSLAVWYGNSGEGAKAIPLLREVLDLPAKGAPLPPELHLRASAFLASQLTTNSDCSEAIGVAERGLDRLADTDPRAPDRLWLLRTRASALRACARPAEAETALRELMVLQERLVGKDSMPMLQLSNELALALSEQGRFRDAAQVLSEVRIPADEGPYNRAVLNANLALTFEDVGDYAREQQLLAQAQALLDEAGIEHDNDGRRTIARLAARAQGLGGQPAKAAIALAELRERARRIDGEDSSEYANTSYQLAFAQQRAGKSGEALPIFDEARRIWARKLPPAHRNLALLARLHAAIALDHGELDLADRELAAARDVLRAGAAPASNIAIVQAEQAKLRLRQGRRDEARELIAAALPRLKDAFLPTHVSLVDAERTAAQLGKN